jgi:hypothetical protein
VVGCRGRRGLVPASVQIRVLFFGAEPLRRQGWWTGAIGRLKMQKGSSSAGFCVCPKMIQPETPDLGMRCPVWFSCVLRYPSQPTTAIAATQNRSTTAFID